MKTSAQIENVVEIIMLSTTKITHVMLLTVILVSMMIHTSVWAKDFNEKAVDVSARVTKNAIALQQGVENTTMLYGMTKEGLVILRNKIKLFDDMSKKLGNKRLADLYKGAVRQLTKNFTKMDGVFKKLGNSKIGKAAKHLKGVGTAINVVDKTAFTTDYITRAKDIVKQGNFKEEAASFRMDGIVYIANMVFPFSGELIESINNSMKGIDQEIDKIRNSLLDRYVEHTDDFALLYKKERFNLRIKEYEANINQASDFNDLQEIYSLTLKEEIRAYERLIKDIDDSIKDARNLKSFPGRKSQIESLESLKWSVENRLSRIKSGGNIEKQLRDIFYVTAGSITAVEVDQQQEQTHNSINAQADQLAASKERILSLANMDIENLTGKGSTLDYKTLDDSELSKLMLDLNLDNTQEIKDVQNFRFSTDPVNQQQKEEQNTQNFNDDQRIKTVNLVLKQRQEEQQRIKLLSGNYAFGTIIGGNFSRNSENQSGFIGVDTTPSVDGGTVDRYLFGYKRNILPVIRNGNSISIGLSFDNLKESVPSNSSDNTSRTSLVSSDRVRARSGDYGDYSYIAWGSWSGGANTRYRNYDRIRGGHWIYGQRLETVDIPKSGSARYVGQVRGDYVHRGRATVEMNSITGDINMAVTFRDGNNSLSGAMNLDRNGTHWARARFNTQNARFSSGSNIFRTSLKVQGGGRGQLRGSFFGANAAEAGGSFAVNKDGIAVGVFRAKKQ